MVTTNSPQANQTGKAILKAIVENNPQDIVLDPQLLACDLLGLRTRSVFVNTAADLGHLECLEQLAKLQFISCTSVALVSASANGHYAVVEWLCERDGTSRLRVVGRTRREGFRVRAYSKAIQRATFSGNFGIAAYLSGRPKGKKCWRRVAHSVKSAVCCIVDVVKIATSKNK